MGVVPYTYRHRSKSRSKVRPEIEPCRGGVWWREKYAHGFTTSDLDPVRALTLGHREKTPSHVRHITQQLDTQILSF